jgi:predicted AlkP superfamily phosphohydrolase/phosphomutase
MQAHRKILVIGLDGADWHVLQPYLDNGTMRNLAHLIETGTSGELHSTIPTHSAVAWVSFMTGQNPGRHGVFDFVQRSPYNRMRMVKSDSRSIQSETFLHILGRHNRRVGAIHIPLTYPPFPVNGFLLSGMAIPERTTYTHPEGFADELDKVGGFPLNLMDWRFMLESPEALIDQAIAATRQRARVLHYVIENKSWDVLVQVFVSPDRLQHPLMHILDPMHPLHNPLLAQRLDAKLQVYFATLDDVLGMAKRSLPDDVVLMVLSDHGFRSVYKLLNLKKLLKRTGMLNTRLALTVQKTIRQWLRKSPIPFRRWLPHRQRNAHNLGSPMLMADLDWTRTRAYTTTYTGQDIVVNLKSREPGGIVAIDEKEGLLDDIRSRLLAQRDPENGTPLIKNVVRASDLYCGPYLDEGPDLLVVPADGLVTCAVEKGPNLMPLRVYMGAHRQEGVFVANGQGIKAGKLIADADLLDLAPTILYLADVPIPTDMDGQVLDLFSDDRLSRRPPAYQAPTIQEKAEYTYHREEEQEVEERLRGLGYL